MYVFMLFIFSFIYYKELSHPIMVAGKFKFAVWASRLETQESRWCR